MSNEIDTLKMAFADEGGPHEQIGQVREGEDGGRGDERRGQCCC